MANSLTPFAHAAQESEKLKSIICSDYDEKSYSELSQYAACLIPLLTALKWNGNKDQIAESLPHFATSLDLVDLRNILGRLGYKTSVLKTKVKRLNQNLLPALFVTEKKQVFVLLDKENDGKNCFNGTTKKFENIDSNLIGKAYVIEEIDIDQVTENRETKNWFAEVVHRFRNIIAQTLVVTFFANILSLSAPIFILLIYDKVIGNKSPSTLIYLVAGMVTAIAVEFALRNLRSKSLSYIGARLDYILGINAFQQVLHLPPSFTEKAPVGGQVSRIKEFESIREFFISPLATVFLDLPFLFIFLFVIALLGGTIALVPLFMVIVFVVLGIIIIPRLHRSIDISSAARSKKQSFTIETLSNMRAVKNLGAEEKWLERYRKLSAKAAITNYSTAKLNMFLQTASQGIMMLTGISILAFGTHKVINGDMTVGALIATMALCWRVLTPLQIGFTTLTRFEQVLLGIKQINSLMRFRPEFKPNAPQKRKKEIIGQVGFARVSIRYSPQSEPALLGVSFNVNPGESIAIIGQNGSGKSTLIKLIAGLYIPQGGIVFIDNVDLRQINPRELRSTIGYVPQYSHHFYGTIAQNLRLSKLTAKDEELVWATKMANVYDEIMALPKGFESRIGDHALNQLPSGFYQKIALARAYIRKPRILLIDEGARNLDWEDDQVFIKTLKNLKGKTTVIFVTHRPSHMKLADRVLYLNKGQMELMGPPDEVLAQIPEGLL